MYLTVKLPTLQKMKKKRNFFTCCLLEKNLCHTLVNNKHVFCLYFLKVIKQLTTLRECFFFFFKKNRGNPQSLCFIVGTAGATYRPRALFRSCCTLHLDSIVLLTGLVIMMVQGSCRIKKL